MIIKLLIITGLYRPNKVKGVKQMLNKNDDNELQDIVIQTPRLFCESE